MVMVAGWGGAQEEKSSAFKASGNLFIAVVGAGVLGLPYAFRQSGLLLGAGFLTFVAAGALYCMLLLVRCKRCGDLHRAGIWPVFLLQNPSVGGVCTRLPVEVAAAFQTRLCKQRENEQQEKRRDDPDPVQLAGAV